MFETRWFERGGGISKVCKFARKLDGAGYIAKLSSVDSRGIGTQLRTHVLRGDATEAQAPCKYGERGIQHPGSAIPSGVKQA